MANTGSIGQSPIPHWEQQPQTRDKKRVLQDENRRVKPVTNDKSTRTSLKEQSIQKIINAFKENDPTLLHQNYEACRNKSLDFAKIVSRAIKQLPTEEQEESKSLLRDFFGNKLTEALDEDEEKAIQVLQEVEASGDNLIDFMANLIEFDDEHKERLVSLLGSYLEKKIGVDPLKVLFEPFTAQNAHTVQKTLQLCLENHLPLHCLLELCAMDAKEAKKEFLLLIEALIMQDVDAVQACLKKKKDPLAHLESALLFVPNQEFGKRLLLCTKTLMNLPGEKKALSALQGIKISLFVEKQLHQLNRATGTEYVAKEKKGLERALGFDFEQQTVFVFSKKAGELQKRGSEKKATYAFKLHLADAVPTVSRLARLVNIADDEVACDEAIEIVEGMKKEIQLERLFNDDVHVLFEHVNKEGKAKLTAVVDLYEKDLDDYVRDKKEDYAQMRTLLQSLVGALDNIHGLGFVHNDLKGANLVIRILPDGSLEVKVIDFGKTYNGIDYKKINELGYGSTFFSAPETFKPSLKLADPIEQGKAEDMYALGCMLYSWLLRQEIPWAAEVGRAIEAPSDTASESAYDRQCDEYKKIGKAQSDSKDETKQLLFTVCLKLLEPDPSKRLTLDGLREVL